MGIRRHCILPLQNMQIYVHILGIRTLTLTVERCDTTDDVKAKIEDMEGIHPSAQKLIYAGHQMENRRTLADYNIRNESNLHISLKVGERPQVFVKTSNGNTISVEFNKFDTVNNVKAKVGEKEGIPFDNHGLFFVGKQLEDTHTLVDYRITFGSSLRLFQLSDASRNNPSSKVDAYEAKLKVCLLHQAKATEAINELISEVPHQMGSELEDMKHQMAIACRKQKELEATVSKQTRKNKVVFARCAYYERQLAALDTENKKLKRELIQGIENFTSTEKGKAFLEGEKTKWLKSVEFLNHLAEGALQYFDYGFDSCQKQAEQQGFVGQLNKDAALQEAPEIKGSGLSEQT